MKKRLTDLSYLQSLYALTEVKREQRVKEEKEMILNTYARSH